MLTEAEPDRPRPRFHDETLTALKEARPELPDRFAWLKESMRGTTNVFITFVVAGGLIISAIGWLVDRIASKTSGALAEERLAADLRSIAYPPGGIVVDDGHRAHPGRARRRRRPTAQAAPELRPHMKVKPTQVAIGSAGIAIGVFGVLSLREATLSTHGRVDPESRVELVLHAETHRPEPRQTLPEMVEGLLLACRLEVSSDVVGPIVAEGDGRFRAVLRARARRDEPEAANRLSRGLDDRQLSTPSVVSFHTVP